MNLRGFWLQWGFQQRQGSLPQGRWLGEDEAKRSRTPSWKLSGSLRIGLFGGGMDLL
jgi:hypothetical protein